MIEVYSSNQVVATGSSIPLSDVALKRGKSVSLQGASSILLNTCGIYEVTVNASAISSEATGTVSMALVKNGVIQEHTTVTQTVYNATGIHNLSLTTLVQVDTVGCNCCSQPTAIAIQNTGSEATFDIDVVVTKVR